MFNNGLSLVPQSPDKRDGTFVRLNVSKDETEADLEIWDFIGDDWYGTTARQIIEQLKDMPKSIETIRVAISSPGGYVWDAIEMYEALKKHPAKVVTEVNAIAASAASLIFMAGDERIMGPHADLMIHKPSSMVFGTADEMRKEADLLDQAQDKLIAIYLEGGSTEEEESIHDMVNRETWMSAEEAVNMGFATEVTERAKAVACVFDVEQLRGCPDHHKRLARAAAKRRQEKAERDAGKSARAAKTAVAGSPERDAGTVDITADMMKLIDKMEIR